MKANAGALQPEDTETLFARDMRVYASMKANPIECLRHASQKSGRAPLALALECIKLLRGPGRMPLREYVQYGIYDPALTEAERQRFITNTLHWPIASQCCDMTWQATTEDSWLCALILSNSGIPMPRTLAVVDRSERTYPNTCTIRTPAELREFALVNVRDGVSVFGKENRGVSGFGTLHILEAESDRLHLEGEGWFSYEHFLSTLIGDAPYIFQLFEQNHAFIGRYSNHLATIRLCLLLTQDGPTFPFVVLKLPSEGRNSDHFWRKGNLACDVDPETGTIQRARTKDALGTTDYTDHPETGTPLVGEVLPLWNEVLDLARNCARIFSPIRYQSMDVALTPDGPMLIEINTGGGFDLPQLASGRGFLTDEVQAFFRECGVQIGKGKTLRTS